MSFPQLVLIVIGLTLLFTVPVAYIRTEKRDERIVAAIIAILLASMTFLTSWMLCQ